MITARLPQEKGFSLVEMMVAVVVFAVIMSVAMGAFIAQLESNAREYSLAEAEIENNIALNSILKNDISLAGYGLANDYDIDDNGTDDWTPAAVAAVNNVSSNDDNDELLLTGTALGMNSRAAKGWSYYDGTEFATWTDPRENIQTNTAASKRDVVLLMEPNRKALLTDGAGNWRFRFNGATNPLTVLPGGASFSAIPEGTLAYGFRRADNLPASPRPYYTVRYYLGGTSPKTCAPNTQTLERGESLTADDPTGQPLLSCVRNFQVAFGLDTNEDGIIDLWDDGGTTLQGYSFENQRKRVKQVRIYLLVQNGRRDPDYQYPAATVRVGDTSLGVGENVALTAEQRSYRWRLLSLSVVPKNIRW